MLGLIISFGFNENVLGNKTKSSLEKKPVDAAANYCKVMKHKNITQENVVAFSTRCWIVM